MNLRPTAFPLSHTARHIPRSVMRDLIALAGRPEVISFAGGLPAADCLPLDEIEACLSPRTSAIGRRVCIRWTMNEEWYDVRGSLLVHPLTADRWGDLEQLFTSPGGPSGCWCMWFRLRTLQFRERGGAGNREAMAAITRGGEVPGLIAYLAGNASSHFRPVRDSLRVYRPLLAFAASCTSFSVVTLVYVWQRLPMAPTRWGLLWAVLSGVCGAIGVLLFSMAIKLGNTALVVTLGATYPAFTVHLAPLVLQEQFLMRHALGVLLVTLGVMLLAR